jgi:AraC-like DNA-binding protein
MLDLNLTRMRMVRAGFVHGVPALLATFGLDPSAVIHGAGVEPRDLLDPENLIPFRGACNVVARSAAATGCPHFGLLLGRDAGSVALGLVGLASRFQPDVRSALAVLVKSLQVGDRGGGVTVTQQDGVVRLGYIFFEKDVPAHDQVLDLVMTIAVMHLRQICGPGWSPSHVSLQRRRPADLRPWQAVFRAPIAFEAEESSITFPEAWLDQSIPDADPVLRRVLEQDLLAAEASVGTRLSDEIERAMKPMLAARASVERAARLLGVNRRTLARRLAREDTSFREVQQRARFATAKDMLTSTGMPLSEIAIVLGYSDASAFTRAFHRWSGTSPSAWRRMVLCGPGHPASPEAPRHRPGVAPQQHSAADARTVPK